MKKMNTAPISGTQELLPATQATFNTFKSNIETSFKTHGFLNIETPILERTEVIFAKAGGDTEKQIYRVFKTSENPDDSDQALRFDHTVPLARYIVEHENDLNFPFKVFQSGENFRGERAQKGRFREFYQCDIDVIGRNELSLFYDADVISTLLDTYQNLGLSTPIVVRISNRKILKGLLEGLNLQEKAKDIYGIIDHAEKVSAEKTNDALTEIGLTEDEKTKILDFINLSGDKNSVISELKALNISNQTFTTGIEELESVIDILIANNQADFIKADMRIVRGLDYYTGTVFEFIMPEHLEVGSIGGGGRYDNLTTYFTEHKFPGVGGSIGLNRFFSVLIEKNLISTTTSSVDYAIIPLSDNELTFSMQVAKDLRSQGNSVTIILENKKFGDKMKYASKIAKNAIVIGESEVASGTYEVKQFK
ncbi:MAG: histidine--tRNA ligase [Candidatus Saccharibacteria bacterium]|nr:histidine--tRNA ligase [Candidatus Saccharibacteria bacterium]